MTPTSTRPILFPTDFEFQSEVAFEHAARLASDAGAPLIALHVCNMPDMPSSDLAGASHHEMLRGKLQQVQTPLAEVEHVFTAIAEPGPEICRLAEEQQCGMIVMGYTDRTGMDELAGCGVHDYVQQHASCPVVTLRAKPQRIPDEARWN